MKYGRGALLSSQLRHLWIVGFIERDTKRRFMVRVYRRNIKYMDPIMRTILKPGCTIYTDKFRTYSNFMTRNPGIVKKHESINHKEHFVDPTNSDVHTQTIESNWKQAKKAIKSYLSLDVIDEYLAEYQYKCNYFIKEKHSYEQNYVTLLKHIAKVFAPQGCEGLIMKEVLDPQLSDGFVEDTDNAVDNPDDADAFYDKEELMNKVQFDKHMKKQLFKEFADMLSDDEVIEDELDEDVELIAWVKNWISKKRVISYSRLVQIASTDILNVIGKRSNGWVNDEAINAYLQLVSEKYTKPGYKIIFTNTNFFPALIGGGETYQWVDDDELAEADIIFIPIHEADPTEPADGHWFLGIVDHRQKRFIILNSIARRHKDEYQAIRTYMEQLHSSRGLPRLDEYQHLYCLSKKDVPQQTNGVDCGVYTMLFAKIYARDGGVKKSSINAKNIRIHRYSIARDLIRKKIEG